MVAPISSSTVENWSTSLFNKLDTKKQGYIDQSDLAAALGNDTAGAAASNDDAAEMLKQFDGDADGKVTKSELSSAIGKVADALNAQFDSSRVDKTQAGAAQPPAGAGAATSSDAASDTAPAPAPAPALDAAGKGKRAAAAQGGGAPAAGASDTASTNKYTAAADLDNNGSVSDDEAAAYKKLMAAQQSKHAQPDQANAPADSERDLHRALDLLKQYVDNGNAGNQAASASAAVDVKA